MTWSTVIGSLLLGALACSAAGAADTWRVESSGGRTAITLTLTEPEAGGSAEGKRLYYTVEHRGATVLPRSPLGISRADQDFLGGLSFDRASEVSREQQSYRLVHGKRSRCDYVADEQTVCFKNAKGARLEVILRAQDDGVAFRYRFPEKSSARHTVTTEHTGFRLPAGGAMWVHPYDKATQYSPAYETYYADGVPVGTPAPAEDGWAYPVLFRTAEGRTWGLITEAALDGTYCGSRLAQTPRNGVYPLRLPAPGEGNNTGSIEPSSTLPWQTPWRAIMLADSPLGIIESTFITDCNPPSIITDTSWIKPGRASWSWLSDHDSPQDCAKLRTFVDLAAAMGWEYSLVDANWTIMKNGTIHDLLAHASRAGVGLLLWYNSGGKHNYVSEKPRGLMFHRPIRRGEFKLLKRWGVKGVKVDFFQSDKQEIIALYHDILRDAADFQIMVNFHGCTLPRGWSRTYPHLMTMEAVRGAECYSFDRAFTATAPGHNTIIPFTRNAVGPMDYTPVMFEDNVYRHLTTYAHELALPVIFESGLTHFADRVRAYQNLPEAPREFLKRIPAAWDDTRCLAGEPGRVVVIARRCGDTWYVGGITGEKKGRDVFIKLEFLGDGASYDMHLIEDGTKPRTFATQTLTVTAGTTLTLKLRGYGGFAATVTPR